MGKVQMDMSDEDVRYFSERGLKRRSTDLNCVDSEETHHGFLVERRYIVGRSHGWRWYRNIWNQQDARMVRQHIGALCFDTPVACYIDAELCGWRSPDGDE